MNRYLKQEIIKAFEFPEPNQQEKMRFLRTYPKTSIRMRQFILIQIAYLRKWILVLSVLLLLPALMSVLYINQDTLWAISALIPFLGLLAVTESTRSAMYGMYEFEMSTKFSLKSVMLARMSILGIVDVFVLCCFTPLCCIGSNISLLQSGIYLFVPYLLTVNISLWITRCFPGREAIYSCMCIAVLVSGANWGLHIIADFVYQISCIHWWIILFAFLICRMAQEIYHTIKQTEEFVWNL